MMRFLVLLVCSTALISGCTSDSSSGPVNLTDTAWAGDCEPASQGSQQAVIAYSAGSFSVRTFFFSATSSCDNGWDRRGSATTGSYVERGLAGVATEIDISGIVIRDSREQTRHEAMIPRSFDVYYIENGLLFYGDYGVFDGSSDTNRPINFGTPSVAEAVNIDIADVF